MNRYKRILSGILYFTITAMSFAQMTVSGIQLLMLQQVKLLPGQMSLQMEQVKQSC